MIKKMKKIYFLICILFACSIVYAQEEAFITGNNQQKVEIKIDGMACPFCAFGLEKKLKEIAGLYDLKIEIDDGVAIFKIEEGKTIPAFKINDAVVQAGFTPRELRVKADEN